MNKYFPPRSAHKVLLNLWVIKFTWANTERFVYPGLYVNFFNVWNWYFRIIPFKRKCKKNIGDIQW